MQSKSSRGINILWASIITMVVFATAGCGQAPATTPTSTPTPTATNGTLGNNGWYTSIVPSQTKVIPPTHTPTITPTEIPGNAALQFLRDYFSLMNGHQYEEGWAKLSGQFQNNLGELAYVEFWSTVSRVEIQTMKVTSISDSEVYVYAEITYYYVQGDVTTGHTTYRLVPDAYGTSWLIAPN